MTSSSGGVMAKLPPWLSNGLRDGRQWKTFVRCMVTLFVSLVLMYASKPLQLQGQAAFFSSLLVVILPPYFALSLFILAFMTMGIGMLVGWAWSCAAMAAALRARDQTLLKSQVERLSSGLAPGQNIDAQFQISVFHGDFLDPRSSTVFAVFFFFGAYFFGYAKAVRPRLILFSIFGSIIMDVLCLYGPLFPVAQYELPRVILLPTAFYFAIALATTTLIFPQSLNHQLTTAITNTLLKPLLSQLKLQGEILKGSPSDVEHIAEQAEQARALRKGLVLTMNTLQGQMSLLQLEVTRGQISGTNLAKVFAKLKQVIGFSHVLASFSILLEQDHKTRDHVDPRNVQLKRTFEDAEKYRPEGTSMEDFFPVLEPCTRDLRQALERGIEGVIDWLGVVNHSRWRAPPKTAPGIMIRQAALDQLQNALAEFRKTKHFGLLDKVKDLFDASGHLKPDSLQALRWSSMSLFRCHVFTTSLIGLATFVVELLELLLSIERENPRARLQWPAAFTKMLAKAANDPNADGNPLELGKKTPDDDTSSEITLVNPTRTYARDPDAEDPRNVYQRVGRKSATLWGHLVSPQGLFALKYALISVALFVPSVCHSSAFFVYSNKGLWAVIMAQLALGVYTGEQIIAFIVRLVGTAIGLVNGMVIWYIGAGRGHGNPYGLVAASMVFTGPFLFVRLISPQAYMPIWMMSGVMSVFVVGYSWVDEHVIQVANAGFGAALAGRRALLVIIGFTAAFIMMLFPRPFSAKTTVRLSLAKCVEGTGELYGVVVQAIEDDVEDGADESREKADVQGRVDRIRGKFIALMTQVAAVEQQIAFASYEPGWRGPWPKARYEAIWKAELGLLNALVLLGSAYARLTPQWARRLERTNLMNPDFITDCLHHFHLLHSSLSSGKPLPVHVSILERLAYHWSQTRHQTTAWQGPKAENFEQKEEDQALAALGEPLTWDLCHDEQMAVFAAATVAMTYVASGLEELTREVIGLVGEAEYSGLTKARERRN